IIKAFNTKINDLVIDYEHQTLTGEEAPAAGWIKELINKGTEGLWAKVEWTPRGEEYIKNKEYRYLSPVILVNKKDGRAILVHSAALTNTPAIDGMVPIVNSLGANAPESEESNEMELLKKLAALLGLAETATEEEITAAITKLKDQPPVVANKEVLNLLDLKEGATLDETKGAIIALKNPSGYVKAEEFNALKDKLDLKERDELVNLALTSGKITPAQKPWAEAQALKDPAGFKAFLDAAPRVVPLDKLLVGDPPVKDPVVSDEVQLSVNKQLGISEEDFKKFNS
ncbi:MAG: phage protease, partial [Bacteroidota bacterium]